VEALPHHILDSADLDLPASQVEAVVLRSLQPAFVTAWFPMLTGVATSSSPDVPTGEPGEPGRHQS